MIISISLYKGINFQGYKDGKPIIYGGITQATEQPHLSNKDDIIRKRLTYALDIEFLNSLTVDMFPDNISISAEQLESRVTSIKVLIMNKLWDSDWGDFNTFRIWTDAGAPEPAPPALLESATYFLQEP